ncbi:MAG: hypothetical protein AAF412_01495, partial [Pseudomonadota bacterium]
MTFTRKTRKGQPKQAQTMSAAENYQKISEELVEHASKHNKKTPHLVVVSKTFDADTIRPVIHSGARIFGENRVQEALGKWPGLKQETP